MWYSDTVWFQTVSVSLQNFTGNWVFPFFSFEWMNESWQIESIQIHILAEVPLKSLGCWTLTSNFGQRVKSTKGLLGGQSGHNLRDIPTPANYRKSKFISDIISGFPDMPRHVGYYDIVICYCFDPTFRR